GVRVRFLPSCLIPSYGECSFAELLEFTTRQIIITRVYHPKLWALGLIAQTTFNLSFWGLVIVTLAKSSGFAVLLWAALFGLSIVRCAVRFSAVRSVLNDVAMPGFGWFCSVSSPLVALLYQYNMVCAALTRRIEWRQVHYDLVSPNET